MKPFIYTITPFTTTRCLEQIKIGAAYHDANVTIIGIGSGGNYALAAAKVLMETDMKAEEIAKKAIKVASEICVFTNNNITMEKL